MIVCNAVSLPNRANAFLLCLAKHIFMWIKPLFLLTNERLYFNTCNRYVYSSGIARCRDRIIAKMKAAIILTLVCNLHAFALGNTIWKIGFQKESFHWFTEKKQCASFTSLFLTMYVLYVLAVCTYIYICIFVI